MTISERAAVIATVSYADIFEYPLTRDELAIWLIGSRRGLLPTQIAGITTKTIQRKSYVFLDGRQNIVATRISRAQSSRDKWRTALRVSRWLRIIPTIRLVGVTGGLAMNNARDTDDIDLFFIVAPRTLWVTRFFVILFISLVATRRRPESREVGNTVCCNMFMTDDVLSLPVSDRDLFSAHEVLQMKPVWERGVYQQFLESNSWTATFLPNVWGEKVKSPFGKTQCKQRSKVKSRNGSQEIFLEIGTKILRFFERPARIFQLWYMKSRRTSEKISDTLVMFHPRDARVWIRKSLQERLKQYNVPLDKVFYAS